MAGASLAQAMAVALAPGTRGVFFHLFSLQTALRRLRWLSLPLLFAKRPGICDDGSAIAGWTARGKWEHPAAGAEPTMISSLRTHW
jgi:hypothetical protein